MLLEPSIKELLEHINSRYLLVNVAAARAREIEEDAKRQNILLGKKSVTLAINEIIDDKIKVVTRAEYGV